MNHFQKTSEILRVQYTIPKVAAMVIQEAASKTAAKHAQHEESLASLREKMRPSKAKETLEGHLIFDKSKNYDLPEGLTADMLQTQKGVVVSDVDDILTKTLPSTFLANQASRQKDQLQTAEWEMQRKLEAEAMAEVDEENNIVTEEELDIDNSEFNVDENGQPMVTMAAPAVNPTPVIPAWEESMIQAGGHGLDAGGYPRTLDGSAISGIPTVVMPAAALSSMLPPSSGGPSLPHLSRIRGGLFEATPTALAQTSMAVPKVPAAFSFETFCKELHAVNSKTEGGKHNGLLSPDQMGNLLKVNRKNMSQLPDAFWVTLMRQASVNVLEREAGRSPERKEFYNQVKASTKGTNWIVRAEERHAKFKEAYAKQKNQQRKSGRMVDGK